MTATSPKSVLPVQLYDVANDTGNAAELWSPITEKNLADWEADWIPALHAQLKVLHQSGVNRALWPQSRKWDWRDKKEAIGLSLANESFSIVAEGTTQAMMIIDLTKRARLQSQLLQHLVYVDFLEAAPWNRHDLQGGKPQFTGAGSIMIGAAIELSHAQGFKGRIGLHSLPQSNSFYANACGMADMGADPNYGNLRYFEMTPDAADDFMKKGKEQ
jgi:hypothetical protein